MIRNLFLLGCLTLLFTEGKAQDLEWHLLDTILVENLDQISIDNRENIFYADEAGNVTKLDAKGIVANEYSPVFQARLDQLEAFFTLNIFLFSADLQQIVLLDVFLNPFTTVSLQQEDIGVVKAATLGNRPVFWMFDEVDLSLIKYDYQRNTILQDQPLSLILGGGKIMVAEILERQNWIFLNIEKQGVFIFDNQGNFIKRLDINVKQKLSIYEDCIYYIQEGLVHQVNFFTGETKKFRSPRGSYRNILVSAQKIIFYSPTFIAFYKWPIFE